MRITSLEKFVEHQGTEKIVFVDEVDFVSWEHNILYLFFAEGNCAGKNYAVVR